jgi:hypothetical protein
LSQQLGSHAVEVDADTQGQPPPVLKACESLRGHFLADDVDRGQAQIFKQLADIQLQCRLGENIQSSRRKGQEMQQREYHVGLCCCSEVATELEMSG